MRRCELRPRFYLPSRDYARRIFLSLRWGWRRSRSNAKGFPFFRGKINFTRRLAGIYLFSPLFFILFRRVFFVHVCVLRFNIRTFVEREVTYVRWRFIKKTIERRIRVFRGRIVGCLEIEFYVSLSPFASLKVDKCCWRTSVLFYDPLE